MKAEERGMALCKRAKAFEEKIVVKVLERDVDFVCRCRYGSRLKYKYNGMGRNKHVKSRDRRVTKTRVILKMTKQQESVSFHWLANRKRIIVFSQRSCYPLSYLILGQASFGKETTRIRDSN